MHLSSSILIYCHVPSFTGSYNFTNVHAAVHAAQLCFRDQNAHAQKVTEPIQPLIG